MSRISESSRPGSAGDADSVISPLFESSPRKPSEFASKGPFGDHSIPNKDEANFAVGTLTTSSESEDQDGFDLKYEYLQRLTLIREKLASLDIANKSYYNNCFGYPPQPHSQCEITEIFDENECRPTSQNKDDSLKECSPSCSTPKPQKQEEIKTLFPYEGPFDSETSSVDLLDLNYNPPKKRPCLRENSPTMIMSDNILPIPYHIRVGLHDEVAKANKRLPQFSPVHFRGRNRHIFPKVQVDCGIGTSPIKSSNTSCDECHLCQKSVDRENLHALFLDTKEHSTFQSLRTETLVTIDSPKFKSKARKLFLRTAPNNKVTPTGNISLFEEIRTIDAINKNKGKSKQKEETSRTSSGKGGLASRIGRMCPSPCNKKSKEDGSGEIEQKIQSERPRIANILLDWKQEQEVYLAGTESMPSSEEQSDFTIIEDDNEYDSSYCFFCSCLYW